MIDFNLDNLDIERLKTSTLNYLKNMGFDDETCSIIVDTGIENLKEEIEQFLSNYTSRNLEKAADDAHTIKGILWNMGLQDEGMLFKEVQLAILDGEDDIDTVIKKALDAISK